MSVFDQTPSRPGSRFGNLSSNMFFTRNTAKPKRVRHIEGLNGALICNVNDDPSLIRSTSTSSLSFNRTNLPAFETPRRVERLVPPMGFWNTHGLIHDTERWKKELAALAVASGLGTDTDTQKNSNKPPPTVDQQHASRSGAHYSTRTGRFNEGGSKSRGRTSSKHATPYSDVLFNVPENEREMWMLQVLCQLLGTSNLEDIQSWLVSASPSEKEQATSMINSALRGLKESERSTQDTQQNVDLNTLSNFVERQKYEEKYASQKFVKDSLNRSLPALQAIDEEQQTDISINDTMNTSRNTNDLLNVSLPPATTYKRAFQNYNKPLQTFDDQQTSNDTTNEEPIDTIQLDDDRQRARSASLPIIKRPIKTTQTSLEKPLSSHKEKLNVESIQFNDEDEDQNFNITYENKTKYNNDENQDEHKQVQETSSSNQTKQPSNENNQNAKSRKIRQLQSKLSRQEEESKKKFDELQSKQSRLENAIKLLVKQTSSFKNRRQPQQSEENVEDLDTPVVNVTIQSPREKNQHTNSNESKSVNLNRKSTKNQNGNNATKIGNYKIQDVKVQISLSRLDNHPTKVYTGIWKPDASTLNRLQGN